MNYVASNSVPVQEAVSTDPATQIVVNRITQYNNVASDFIMQIEDKLHNILNKRQSTEIEKAPEPKIGDFISAVDVQLDRIYHNNARLDSIIRHLHQII